MIRTICLFVCFFCSFTIFAQRKGFNYKFYGFVRGDFYYNSRANMAPVDGTFYLYPLDISPDENGKDMNATANGSFYTFTTRLGLDVYGPKIGKAQSSAKVEVDFGGFSSYNTLLRIRQAYVALDWGRSSVLIGQSWHPLFGSVFPDMLNLSTGAPFQPFNRSPQLRYQYKKQALKVTASALWQLQYTSSGPNGMSQEYMKNSCLPELYAGVDWTTDNGLLLGVDFDLLSLKPRTKSVIDGKSFKVNERMTTFSYGAHFKWTRPKFVLAAKSIMASCLDHTALLGGYGISEINPETGEQKYTPFRHSTTWFNATYGVRWKAHLFGGYTKNMGTTEPLAAEVTYGMGLNLDQLCSLNFGLSYNLPNWQLGVEYMPSRAWYGDRELDTGKIVNTHHVTNQRFVCTMMYYF